VIDAITLNGEIIEEKAEDFRCLVLCKTHQQYVHAVFDYFDMANLISTKIEIVTVYKPDPAYWIKYRKRRK
jgi:hypothetical protein